MSVSDPTSALDALRAEHVPDPRLDVWDVAVEEGALAGATSAHDAREPLARLAAEAGLAFEVTLLPDPDLGAAVRGTVHRSLAHVRAAPRHAAELVTQLVLGETALVLRERGEWLRIQGPDRYVGWAHRGSLLRSDPGDPDAFRRRLVAGEPDPSGWIVAARAAVARRDPAPHAAPAADLVQGGRVAPAGAPRAGWRPIALPDGVEGWVEADAIVPAARLADRFTSDGRAVLDHAAQHLGLPYLWGGTSEKGYDCSGIIQRIYGLHGTRLPRDADQQADRGPEVDPGPGWSGVRDGDLAFFSETGGRATHVGILASDGRMLHASTTRNGVAWDALAPGLPGRATYAERLLSMLVVIRRPLAG